MLQIRVENKLCTLTLDRPEKRNAMNTEMLMTLIHALDQARRDDSISVVVLTGTGTAFCAGADLAEFIEAGVAKESLAARRVDLLQQLLLDLSSFSKPIVSAVNGAAVGAGAAIAIAADIVVMSDTARFGYPETRRGIVPSLMVANLMAQIGQKAAFELLVSGELVDASRVYDLGLANRIVPTSEVVIEAQALATKLADIDARVAGATKRLIQDYAALSIAQGVRHGHQFKTDSLHEG